MIMCVVVLIVTAPKDEDCQNKKKKNAFMILDIIKTFSCGTATANAIFLHYYSILDLSDNS